MCYYERISAAQGAKLIREEERLYLFDVRDSASYAQGHIEGSTNLEPHQLGDWLDRLQKDTPIVIYCYHGNSSQGYAKMFADLRFSRVYSVDGGYGALQNALTA